MDSETPQAPDAAIAAVIHPGLAPSKNYDIHTQGRKGHHHFITHRDLTAMKVQPIRRWGSKSSGICLRRSHRTQNSFTILWVVASSHRIQHTPYVRSVCATADTRWQQRTITVSASCYRTPCGGCSPHITRHEVSDLEEWRSRPTTQDPECPHRSTLLEHMMLMLYSHPSSVLGQPRCSY